MTCFQPGDDAGYLAWLDVHPDGYVINTESGGRGYAKLHRATCGTIRYRPPFIGPSYIKICSTSLEEADEWARQRKECPPSAAKHHSVGRDTGHDWPLFNLRQRDHLSSFVRDG